MEEVKNIFKKRIFLTRNINPEVDEALVKHRLGFLAARHGYYFLSIEEIYKHVDLTDPAQTKDPHFIINIIDKIVNSSKTFQR